MGECPSYLPGDIVIIHLDRHRRWWQFWKPRSWIEQRRYRVMGTYGGPTGSVRLVTPYVMEGKQPEPDTR